MPAVMQVVRAIMKVIRIRPDFKVMDKNDPKVKAALYITVKAPCRFESCSPTNHTLKNKHSYDTLNSKRSRGTENFVI
jgi:hypothetical protein